MRAERRVGAASFFPIALLLVCPSSRAQVQAQAAQNQLYQVYSSTSAPSHYKRAIGRILSSSSQADSSLGAAPASNASGDSTPAVLSADPTFFLRDLYAFPNPSRHGQPVTIRVQVGEADSIDLHVYDISGKLVHSDAFGPAQILDDGNGKGPQYTSDCAWDVSGVGSGIYIYSITAHKAGQSSIRKIGKVGIVR